MAPSARLRAGSGTTSDSSYSSIAPKPLHWAQAPRGLLNENRAGVTVAAGVSQALQAGNRVNRSRSVPEASGGCSTTAIPSPSWNAVAIDSVRRPATEASATSRSTTTSSSSARVRSSAGGSSSR